MNQPQPTPPPSQLRTAVRAFGTVISLLLALVGVALALVAGDVDAVDQHVGRADAELKKLEQLVDEQAAPAPPATDTVVADTDADTDPKEG